MKLSVLTNLSAVSFFLLASQIVNAQTTEPMAVEALSPVEEALSEEVEPSSRAAADLSEEAESQDNSEEPVAQGEEMPAPMVVKSRFGGQFTTGAGVGYESSFGSVSGFVPFSQTPGKSLFYFNGRVNLDTEDGDFGSNALLGYREYSEALDTVFGGYLGFDVQNTDNDNTFSQIGVGFEALGNPWEVRANGYIPVGDRRELITEVDIPSQPSTTTFNFQGNSLAFNTLIPSSTNIKVYEESLLGLDIEGGIRLLDWGNGNLRGYLGTYYYDTPSGSGFVGLSSRLLAEISDNFNAGVSFTTDGEFGTNVVFMVGASIGGAPDAKEGQSEAESVLARLGDTINRQTNIAMRQEREESITEAREENGFVTDPQTGSPVHLVHVSPGGNSDGSFEDPFGTIDEAIAAVPEGGIIYVDDFVKTPGDFTIPDTVLVLSRGPEQFIDTVEFNTIPIPLSGNGNFPTIAGTITMGNDTALSGFTITPPANQSAVIADSITNASIRDNTIRDLSFVSKSMTMQDSAIRISNTTGDVEILNNTIRNLNASYYYQSSAIKVADITGNLTIEGNTIENIDANEGGGRGIYFVSLADDGEANISIIGNEINNTNGTAIQFEQVDNNAILNLEILDNNISYSGDDGIYFDEFADQSRSTITISGNTIANISDDGIYIEEFTGDATTSLDITDNVISDIENKAIGFDDFYDTTVTTIEISGNTITNADYGVYFDDFYDSTVTTIEISGNTITDVREDGIYFQDFEDETNSTITISGNTITGSGDNGIQIDEIYDDTTTNITIVQNTITDSGNDGIFFDNIEDDAVSTITISSNTITNSGDDGIEFDNIEDDAVAAITISSNTITNSGNDGIYFDNISEDVDVNITISNNTITSAAGEGISLIIADSYYSYSPGAPEVIVTISGNTISDITGDDGIDLKVGGTRNYYDYGNGYILEDASPRVTATITGNVLNNINDDGLDIDQDSIEDFCLVLNGNTVTNAGDVGFSFNRLNSGVFQIVDRANVLTSNTGTFDPADINTNANFADGTSGVAPCP